MGNTLPYYHLTALFGNNFSHKIITYFPSNPFHSLNTNEMIIIIIFHEISSSILRVVEHFMSVLIFLLSK